MIYLQLLILFAVGTVIGWCLEFFFRWFVERRRNNFGFLNGPYLPIHGFGLLVLFYFSQLSINLCAQLFFFTLTVTFFELVTGLFFEKYYQVRLWDYSERWLNFKGYICPRYSFYWFLLAVLFEFFVVDFFYQMIDFVLANNWMYVIITFFYVVFIFDVIISFDVIDNLRKSINILNKKNKKKKFKILADFQHFKNKLFSNFTKSQSSQFFLRYFLLIKSRVHKDFSLQIEKYLQEKKEELSKLLNKKNNKN